MDRVLKAAKQFFKKLDKALRTSPLKLPSELQLSSELYIIKGSIIELVRRDIESARAVIKDAEELNHYIEKYVPKMLDILDSWFHNTSNLGVSESQALVLVDVIAGLMFVPCYAVSIDLDKHHDAYGLPVNDVRYSDKALEQILSFKHTIARFNFIAAKVFASAKYEGDLSVLAQKMATSSEAKARADIIMSTRASKRYVDYLLSQGMFLYSSFSMRCGENRSEWVGSVLSSVADMMRFMMAQSEAVNVVPWNIDMNILGGTFCNALFVACCPGIGILCDDKPEHQIIRFKDLKLLIELQITAMEDYLEFNDPTSEMLLLFKFKAGSLFAHIVKTFDIGYRDEIVTLRPLLDRMIKLWIKALNLTDHSVKGRMQYATAAYFSSGFGKPQREDFISQLVGTLGMYGQIMQITKMPQLPSVDYMDLLCLVVEELMARPTLVASVTDLLVDIVECLNCWIFEDQQVSIEGNPDTETTSSLLRLYQATWRLTVKLIKAYPQANQLEGSKHKVVDRPIELMCDFQTGLLFQKYMESDLLVWGKEHFDLVLDSCINAQKVAKVLAEPATRLVIAALDKAPQDDGENHIQNMIQALLHRLVAPLHVSIDKCLALCSEEDVGATKYAALALHLSGLGELIWSLPGGLMDGSASLPETCFLAFQAVVEMFPFKKGHAAINYRPYYEAVEVLMERSDEEAETKSLSKEEVKDFYQSWDSRSEDDIRTGALLKAAILARHSRCANPDCINVDGFAEYRLKSSKCSACNVAFYCSKACQKAHWKSGHKQECSSLKEYLPDE